MPMNKLQTLASYENRLSRVVDHIYAHLDDDIRFDDLAEVACLSPYHWHRIYAAIRGERFPAKTRPLRWPRAPDRLEIPPSRSRRLRRAPATRLLTPSR